MTSSPHGSLSPWQVQVQQLLGLRKLLATMITVARTCSNVIDASRQFGLTPLPFLDSDAAYSILPSGAVCRMLNEALDSPPASVARRFHGLVHTTTLLAFVRMYEKGYYLPPGTWIELRRLQRELRVDRQQDARSISRYLIDGFDESDDIASATISTHWRRFRAKSFRTQILSFMGKHADLSILSTVFANGLNADQLLHREPSQLAQSVFELASDRFSQLRPTKTINNYRDSLNAAAVADVLDQRTRRGRSTRYLPILVSNTTEVISTIRMIEPLQRAIDGAVDLVSRSELMWLLSALPERLGNSELGEANADFVRQLLRDLEDVDSAFSNFSLHLRTRGSDEQSWPTGPEDNPDLEYHWDVVVHRTTVFVERWHEVLGPTEDVRRFDYATFINAFDSTAIDELASSVAGTTIDRRTFKSAKRRLRAQLTQLEFGRRSVFDAMVEIGRERIRIDPAHEEPEMIAHEFPLTHDGRPSYLLRKTGPGAEEPLQNASGEYRLVLHRRYLPDRGAVLAVDWQPDVPGWARVTWTHTAEFETLWQSAFEYVRSHLNPEAAHKYFRYRFFGDEDSRGVFYVRNHRVTRDALRSQARDDECFELGSEQVTFYADLKPLAETEMQAGVMLGRLCAVNAPNIATLIESTTGYLVGVPGKWESVVRYVADFVEQRWQESGKETKSNGTG